jgi:hypothetical protein
VYTSNLLHCLEVGASGSKNLNRFRFALTRGTVEWGPSVLQKKDEKKIRVEMEERGLASSCDTSSDTTKSHNQPGVL